MKKSLIIIFFLTFSIINAQTKKVAILDFENTSKKTEYDGLGKALCNMLITDLKNNIHPKKVQFYERGQLNKILDEQNLQKSKAFDKKTAVDFGKLSGSDYVFVGSLFVLEGTCNISSRLVDVQTSEIVLTKDVSGKIEDWLSLKSQLGEGIAQTMNQPLDLDRNYKTQKTDMVTLNQYAKLLSTMDAGDSEKAEQYRSLFEETNPEFKYFTDLKDDIEELKKQVEENKAGIEVLNKSGGRIINAVNPREIVMNIANPLTTYDEASEMIIQLLKFDLETVKIANFDRFESLWLPTVLPSKDQPKKNISFLERCLDISGLDSETCSHYVFNHFRSYIMKGSPNSYSPLTEIELTRILKLGEKLKSYNLKHQINFYNNTYLESINLTNTLTQTNLKIDSLLIQIK